MNEVVEERGRSEPEEEIDAGVVGELSDLPFHKAKHHAETAKQLAFLLVWIMALSVGVHYGLTAYFAALGQADMPLRLNGERGSFDLLAQTSYSTSGVVLVRRKVSA